MWNTFRTDQLESIVSGVMMYAAGGGDMIHAYVSRPEGSGPYPGVVLVQHAPGWDEFLRETSRRLASHNFAVICPDLYCREGHGTPDDVAAIVRGVGGV